MVLPQYEGLEWALQEPHPDPRLWPVFLKIPELPVTYTNQTNRRFHGGNWPRGTASTGRAPVWKYTLVVFQIFIFLATSTGYLRKLNSSSIY